ncbi:MAG TPA: substrate-binding domain-containing protein, partial [Thermoleophilaceae bacterium]|nr:substrate-binding domain-containing protein [Thermoleophilaceae bacterium]
MAGRWARALAGAALALTLALGISACGDDDDGGGSGGDGGGKIALLLPETKTTRYEEQDRPNFERRVGELCADCEVIYANANQDPAKQQQQAEAAITQGAKVIVMSSVDVKSAGA